MAKCRQCGKEDRELDSLGRRMPPRLKLVGGVCGTCRDAAPLRKAETCCVCSKSSSRLVLRDGACGRCWPALQRKAPGASRAAYLARRRRLGGKPVWAAFDRRGELEGVFTSEARALEVSDLVREYRLDRWAEDSAQVPVRCSVRKS